MPAAELPALSPGSQQAAPVTILAVDDDATSRMLTRATLEDYLGAVVEAENGLIGVEALERQDFDLAIVDLDMPVMDGFGLIERARARPETRHLPIIVVTGRDDVVAIERAFALGATSFLCKPINWNVFRHQVSYVLQVAQREREARNARQKAEGRAVFQERAVSALGREVDAAVDGISQLSASGSEAALLQIAVAGHHLRETLARLRRGSEIVTGSTGYRPEAVSASTVADQAVGRVRERLGDDAANRIEVLATASAGVFCDRALAAIALEEVLVNALTYAPSGTIVKLNAVKAAQNRFRFEVEDQGPGIPEQRLAEGFEAFAPRSRETRQEKGLGMGLPMAKAILARHGGHFGIMSEPGRGTEVFLSFPSCPEANRGEQDLNKIAQKSHALLSETATLPAS